MRFLHWPHWIFELIVIVIIIAFIVGFALILRGPTPTLCGPVPASTPSTGLAC